jgi:hypothetical protein
MSVPGQHLTLTGRPVLAQSGRSSQNPSSYRRQELCLLEMCISRSKRLRRNRRAGDREDRRPDRFRLIEEAGNSMAARSPSQEPLLDNRHRKCGQIADDAKQHNSGEQVCRPEDRAESSTRCPRPSRPARISQTTDRMSATVRLSRILIPRRDIAIVFQVPRWLKLCN